MVKKYYLDLFLSGPVYLSVFIVIIGSIAASIYMVESTLIGGIGIETISIFVSIIIYFITQSNKKIALAELELSEKLFEFEFNEESVNVLYHGKKTILEYKNLKVRKLPHFYQFKDKFNSKIYIIPINYFSFEDWSKIAKPINKCLEEEKKRLKEERSNGRNN